MRHNKDDEIIPMRRTCVHDAIVAYILQVYSRMCLYVSHHVENITTQAYYRANVNDKRDPSSNIYITLTGP